MMDTTGNIRIASCGAGAVIDTELFVTSHYRYTSGQVTCVPTDCTVVRKEAEAETKAADRLTARHRPGSITPAMPHTAVP